MIKKILERFGLQSGETDLPIPITEIEHKINYQFKDKNLIFRAFKHRSYLNLTHENSIESNERLEFLGDAVLDLVIADYLYQAYPEEDEGKLSKKRSVLVSRPVLAQLSEEMGLGEYLLLDKGEEKTGGRKRLNNLANLFESVLGAIYLDGGIEAARSFVDQFVVQNSERLLKVKRYHNYKSALLEKAQSKGWGNPIYQIVHESGPDHKKQFVVRVNVNKRWIAKGVGSSKKQAEQLAARNALKKLENGNAQNHNNKRKKQKEVH